ncbi:MAG TPA: hypothetical protein VFY93_18545 [Planctomycetota bacterium]|nr:hypothetical protein [Planctomycetota bacterium]
MKRSHVFAALAAMALFAFAQETSRPAVETYGSIADSILATKAAEKGIVKTILDGHKHAAEGAMRRGDHEAVAANMALFANEGDNAVGGIRKRLLEGGHHHNADGEAKGIYEPGYVVVTVEAKKQCLAAAMAYGKATTDAERKKAFEEFEAVAAKLLAG